MESPNIIVLLHEVQFATFCNHLKKIKQGTPVKLLLCEKGYLLYLSAFFLLKFRVT